MKIQIENLTKSLLLVIALESKKNKSTKLILVINAFKFLFLRAGYYLFNAYFLIFVITSSALTIFSVDCKLPQNRLQITFIILLTSVSFKWVINRYLPTVSYLTSLDTYAIVSILYICLLCVWHSLIGNLNCFFMFKLVLKVILYVCFQVDFGTNRLEMIQIIGL